MWTLAPVLILVLASGPVPGQGRATPPNRVTSPPLQGLLLAAAVPASVPAGAPVPVAVTVVNTGRPNARLFVEHAQPVPFGMAVTTPDGQPAPLTPRDREVLGPQPLSLRARRGIDYPLWEGRPHPLSVPDLGAFYDLTAPGEYHLTVSRVVSVGPGPGASVPVVAPPVAFRVTRP